MPQNSDANSLEKTQKRSREQRLDPEDVAISRRFQAWLLDQKRAKGWTYEDCMNNFNATLAPDEEPLKNNSSLRRLIERDPVYATIRRDTCRRVARMLAVDVNQVLIAAGFLPQDGNNNDDGLPVASRLRYGKLPDDCKARVHDFIAAQWEAHAKPGCPPVSPLPESVQRLYDSLPDAAKQRVHRFIKFENHEA